MKSRSLLIAFLCFVLSGCGSLGIWWLIPAGIWIIAFIIDCIRGEKWF